LQSIENHEASCCFAPCIQPNHLIPNRAPD
jgi:hypothetical protein